MVQVTKQMKMRMVLVWKSCRLCTHSKAQLRGGYCPAYAVRSFSSPFGPALYKVINDNWYVVTTKWLQFSGENSSLCRVKTWARIPAATFECFFFLSIMNKLMKLACSESSDTQICRFLRPEVFLAFLVPIFSNLWFYWCSRLQGLRITCAIVQHFSVVISY